METSEVTIDDEVELLMISFDCDHDGKIFSLSTENFKCGFKKYYLNTFKYF